MITGVTAMAIEIASLRQRLKEAERQRDELKADAERYRWFRSNMHSEQACESLEMQLGNEPTPEELDAAIDAAIAAARKEQK